ncbi:MAG: hypothetical protein ACUVQT_10450 [bacterium]
MPKIVLRKNRGSNVLVWSKVFTFRGSGVDTSLWSFCPRSDCDAAPGWREMPACATADRSLLVKKYLTGSHK